MLTCIEGLFLRIFFNVIYTHTTLKNVLLFNFDIHRNYFRCFNDRRVFIYCWIGLSWAQFAGSGAQYKDHLFNLNWNYMNTVNALKSDDEMSHGHILGIERLQWPEPVNSAQHTPTQLQIYGLYEWLILWGGLFVATTEEKSHTISIQTWRTA